MQRTEQKPAISVVMPTYNTPISYLREAVESILNQTFRDFEFLIIDDGSTNDSPAYLAAIDDQRVRVITNPANIGITKSLNVGLRAARGKYILASTELEKNLILKGGFGYAEDQVWLVGSPCFDMWYHDEKRIVTVIPTWREKLAAPVGLDGMRMEAEGFKNTEYFRFYNALINHKRLLEACREYGYRLQFMPHPYVQPMLHLFDVDDQVSMLDVHADCAVVYAQSDLLVTDYSSVGFDFAYMRKPVLYCQFDVETFFSGDHTYAKDDMNFNYERDGFGEVTYDLESTIDQIIEYVQNGCQLKEKYRERIDRFFMFHDQNNCARVLEKIKQLEEKP